MSIEIQAPPEKVWPMIAWEKTPEWYAPFKKVEHVSGESRKVGEIVRVIGEIAGVKADWNAETTEVVENEKASWRTTSGNFTGFGSNTLTRTKTGTKVTQTMEYDLPYSFLGKIIDKLRVHKAMEKSFEVGLKKLKDMIEK
jgi:uncharacterized membrane protein